MTGTQRQPLVDVPVAGTVVTGEVLSPPGRVPAFGTAVELQRIPDLRSQRRELRSNDRFTFDCR